MPQPPPQKAKSKGGGCLVLAAIAIVVGAAGAHSTPIGIAAGIALVCIIYMAIKLEG